MLCKIADLITTVPEAGDLVPRCQAYRYDGDLPAEIILRQEDFRPNAWQGLTGDAYVYCESGSHFHFHLLRHGGMMLHASAVVVEDRAYLFSAPSGTGKSTHTRLWQQIFGEKAQVINDDKPALRCIDGTWYAYGTPWCGKDGINVNRRVKLAGICFLKQAPHNRIRRLTSQEAVQKIIWQTMRRFKLTENLDRMLTQVDNLVRRIPVYELENLPEPEAARLSYEAMRRGAEEMGL